MSKPKKLHITPADELRASVLGGTPSTALCGRTRVVTPQDIDAIKDSDLPVCKKCSAALVAASVKEPVQVQEPKGWAHFEQVTRPRAFTARATVTATGVVQWDTEVSS